LNRRRLIPPKVLSPPAIDLLTYKLSRMITTILGVSVYLYSFSIFKVYDKGFSSVFLRLVRQLYVFFMRLLKRSLFFEISSLQVSSVYPWTSIPCFFALASSSSAVSPCIVCVQTGSPASLQFNDKVMFWSVPKRIYITLNR
jgi:hypothetical protein